LGLKARVRKYEAESRGTERHDRAIGSIDSASDGPYVHAVKKPEWIRIDDRGNESANGLVDHMSFGWFSIEIEPAGPAGFRADIVGSRSKLLCRGEDREQLKRKALGMVRDELQQMRDAIVVMMGEDRETDT
jgi:hypothetical protein